MTRRLSLSGIWPMAAWGALFLLAWQMLVRGFDLKPYFLPAPTGIWSALTSNFGGVLDATVYTGTNAIVGLLGGVVLGIAVSFVINRSRLATEMLTPVAVALNAIPIVVLVSVLNGMYPATSNMPRRITVALITFFIVLVNLVRGLQQVQPTHLELLRSYAASPWTVLWKARVPNAVPFLFTALRIAAPVAVITALVAEYFGGVQTGLGNRITTSFANSRSEVAWAYVLGACLLGLVFFVIAVVMEAVINNKRGLTPDL